MKTNKIIALILSVILIFSINVTTFAQEEQVEAFEPGLYAETLEMLSALEVTDELFFESGTSIYVTRGEFAELAARLGGIAPVNNYVTSFVDVPESHNFAPYIYALKDAGYMSGVSVDQFLPDEPVYLEQAVSVMVKLLGYGDMAIVTGGYPTGFLSIATKNDLFDGIEPVVGAPILRGDLLELLKNTALCEVLIPASYGTSVSYETREGVDLLAYNHKIYRGTGIVEADAVSSMGQDRAVVGNVVIDGITYKKASEEIITNSVGRKVEYFYKKAGTQKTVLYAIKDDIKEISFIANSDLDFNFTTGVYTLEDEKTLTFKIGDDYKVIYNMSELYPVTADKMLPSSGTVTLIDNDDDSVYEVVIIDEYINIVAENYNAALDKVEDLIDSTRTINFKDYDFYNLIDYTGTALSKTKIKKDDVIEFYESVDGKAFTAIVNSTGIEHIIDGKDEKYIYSGDKKFVFSADLRENIDTLVLGNTYNIYQNTKGEIVYWTRGADYTIGYVVGAKGTTNGFQSEASVMILSTSGVLETIPLADKVKNITTTGMTFSTDTLDKTQYETIFPETNNRELIAYKVNAEGKVSTVYHAMSLATLDEFRNPVPYPIYSVDYYCGSGITANVRGNTFDKKILFANNVSIIVAPPVSVESVDENSFVTTNSIREAFFDDGRGTYTVPSVYAGEASTYMPYMTGDSYPLITHVICHDGGILDPSCPDGANDIAISDIRYVYDTEKEEPKIILEGVSKKTTKSYVLKSKDVLKRSSFITSKYKNAEVTNIHPDKQEIKVGDIVAVITDLKGEVIRLVLLYDRENDQRSQVSTVHRHTNLGTVTYVSNGAIAVDEGGALYHFSASSLPVWVFEKDLNKNYVGGVENIEVGDEVYVLGWSSGLNAITVYKNR